jgi:outer membrane biosynthesis protein TonB
MTICLPGAQRLVLCDCSCFLPYLCKAAPVKKKPTAAAKPAAKPATRPKPAVDDDEPVAKPVVRPAAKPKPVAAVVSDDEDEPVVPKRNYTQVSGKTGASCLSRTAGGITRVCRRSGPVDQPRGLHGL